MIVYFLNQCLLFILNCFEGVSHCLLIIFLNFIDVFFSFISKLQYVTNNIAEIT